MLPNRSGSKSDLTDPFLFLPKNSVNAAEPPRLVIKASPGGGSKADLTDGDDDEKKKKLSAGNSTEDRTWREHELVGRYSINITINMILEIPLSFFLFGLLKTESLQSCSRSWTGSRT